MEHNPEAIDQRTAGSSTPSLEAIDSYIAEQVVEERDRKKSLEARAITVITTSGTFVTAAFAIGAFALQDTPNQLPQSAQALLVLALLAFAAAAGLGVRVNAPLGYSEPSADELARAVDRTNNGQSLADTIDEVAKSRTDTLTKARKLNKAKARSLPWALAIQVLAFVLVAAAVLVTVVL